jgi:hypothetical protein
MASDEWLTALHARFEQDYDELSVSGRHVVDGGK